MCKRTALLLPILALALAVPARAGLATFGARAAFDPAAGRLRAETFAHCARRTTAFTGPLDAADGGAGCAAGSLARGLSISDLGAPQDRALFLAAPHYSGNRGYAVGENGPASDALALDFAGGTRAAGFDIYQNFGGGAQLGRAADFTIRVYSGAALDGVFTVSVPSGRGAFFGVVDPASTITRVSIDNPSAYDTVGYIAFSAPRLAGAARSAFAAPSPAPEPAPLALSISGIGWLARVRRRQVRLGVISATR